MQITCSTGPAPVAHLKDLRVGEAVRSYSDIDDSETIIVRTGPTSFVTFNLKEGTIRGCGENGFMSTHGFERVTKGTEIKITL